jgi:glucokinase
VVPEGIRCGCGNRGCFEMYTSGSALVREAQPAAAQGSLWPPACWTGQAAIGRDHRSTGDRGSATLRPAVASLGRWLGEGIASLTAVLDPAVVVIGGGVSADEAPARAGERRSTPTTGRGYRPMLEIRRAAGQPSEV